MKNIRQATAVIMLLMITVLPLEAQYLNISGKVTDSETHKPLPDVTLYINGTSNGTTSGPGGAFELNGISLPCELILSHVSYQLASLYFEDTVQTGELEISLRKKFIPIMEATVIHGRARADYLDRFKERFLGKDYLKTGARILNDSVLQFIPMEGEQFEAYADQALIIDLPETGYVLKTDLVHFKLTEKEELGGLYCSILGYFYFNEVTDQSRRKQRRFARNRLRTYYNSRDHFCRSLYENKLSENGFALVEVCPDDETDSLEIIYEPGFKRSFIMEGTNTRTRVLELTDFHCDAFYIFYDYVKDNAPAVPGYVYTRFPRRSISEVLFMKDTVRIFPSGRVAENALLFGGDIGHKGVAWTLPDDYSPPLR